MSKINTEYLYDKGQADYTFFNWFFGCKNYLAMHYGFWEKDTRNLFAAQQNQNEYVNKKLNFQPGESILDAGCGVGGTMVYLASNYNLPIIGINISSEQIKKADKYSKKYNVDGLIKFSKQNFQDTNFPNDSFDKIYTIESGGCYANPVNSFVKEIFRILKPGGQILVVDGFMAKPRKDLDSKNLRRLKKLSDVWGLPETNTYKYWLSEIRTGGFENVIWEDLTSKIKKTSRIMFVLAVVAGPIWLLLYYLRFFNKARYSNLMACLRQYKLFKNGSLAYGSIIATKPNISFRA